MKIKKTIIVTLFLLCLLMLGAASAADNGSIVSSDVTKDTVCIGADNFESGQSDDVLGSDEKTQPASSSQETFINLNSDSQNEIDDGLKSTDDNPKLKDNNSMAFDELRDEIENATAGSTIILSKDNYTYENTTPIKVKDNLTIDGSYSWFDGTSANMSGLFCVEGANVVLKNMFFINWELEDSYNIIEWFGENGTLSNCIFVNNIAIDGCVDWSGENGVIDGCYFGYDYGMDNSGALCIYSDGVTVKNSSFITNHAMNNGGAIYSLGSGTTITNCTFTNCSSLTGDGGAVYIYSDYNIITNCTFVNCTALNCGGAIYVSGENNVINDSKFYGNEAFNDGGAIFLVGGECCVNNSNFESNSADEDGGAIYSRGTSVFNIDNSIFADNSAGVYGGALFSENYAIVNSSTFNNNSALAAGAIFSNERINISDSVFNENSAEVAGAIILNDDAGIANSNITNNNAVKGGAIAVLSDLTLEINGTQFKGNLADFGSNNIVLMTNATVMADNKTTSDSPLVVQDTDKPILKDAKITAKTASFVINYAKSYSMTLKDSTGKAVSGKKITFKLNGKTIGSAYTNSKGVATLKITSKMLKTAKLSYKSKWEAGCLEKKQ